jgi:hypothetical protein
LSERQRTGIIIVKALGFVSAIFSDLAGEVMCEKKKRKEVNAAIIILDDERSYSSRCTK